jgi:hypothetical protein
MGRVIVGAVVGLFAGAFVALVFVDAPPVPPQFQAGWAMCLTAGAVIGALIGAYLFRDVVVEHVILGAIKGYGLGFAVFLLWCVCTGGIAAYFEPFIQAILVSLSAIGGLIGGTRAIIAAIDRSTSAQSSTEKPDH